MSSPLQNTDVLARIDAGKAAVLAQTELMHREFGRVKSEWKYDGSCVTAIACVTSNMQHNPIQTRT